MKFRSLPVAAAVAALAVPLVGLVPAYAATPADPVFSGLDSSNTTGHLTGTITSPGAPEIYVRFSNDLGVQYRHVTLGGDSDTFDLPTWGYAASTNIYAYACVSTAPTAECSAEINAGSFTPTDVVAPTITWSADTTLGPADQVTVDAVADTGGGLLFAQFDNDVPNADPPRFALVTSAVANLADGLGAMIAWRCDDLNTDQCVSFDPVSPIFDVRQQLHPTWDPVTKITANHPTTLVQGHQDRTGTYDLAWHLERPGHPDPGVAGTVTGETITDGALAPITIDGADLPTSGTYVLKGTLTVHGDVAGFDGDYVATLDGSVGLSPRITVDRTGPSITAISSSQKAIYPLLTGLSHYPSSTRFTIVGTGVPGIVAVQLYRRTSAGDTYVRDLTKTPGADPRHATAVWTGLLPGSVPAPAGQYVVKVVDSDGNAATAIGSVTASGKKLVRKTWTRTYTPGSTFASSYVGKCSSLREPALRGWYRSFGYYANTRCGSQTSTDSLISTVHSIILPGAVRYLDIRVSAYGGAARAEPGSKAKIRYLHVPSATKKAYWVQERTMSATLATHAGYTSSSQGLVFSDHSFAWGVYTGFGYQYEVKSFTVVLHYDVVGY
ncbi:MAG: hypothetical protein ACJ72L_03510 [Marmoricola sp.]